MTLRELEAHAAENPSDAATRVEIGLERERRGDWAGAVDAYEQALALKPQYAKARRGLERAHAAAAAAAAADAAPPRIAA